MEHIFLLLSGLPLPLSTGLCLSDVRKWSDIHRHERNHSWCMRLLAQAGSDGRATEYLAACDSQTVSSSEGGSSASFQGMLGMLAECFPPG